MKCDVDDDRQPKPETPPPDTTPGAADEDRKPKPEPKPESEKK